LAGGAERHPDPGLQPDGTIEWHRPCLVVAVEVVSYLALPLLGLLAVVAARRATTPTRRLLAGLAPAGLLLVVGLSGRAVARFLIPAEGMAPVWDGDWHSVIVRSFWAKADLFTFGMALAVVYVGLQKGLMRLPDRWPLVALAYAAVLVVPTLLLVDRGLIDKSMYAYQLPTSLACTLLLAVVVLPDRAASPSLLVGLLASRPLVAVGLASYSLFLWHDPVQRLLHERGLTMDGSGGLVVNLAVLGLLSGLLSALTYRYVERPALRRKTRPQPQPAHQTSQPLASIVPSSRANWKIRSAWDRHWASVAGPTLRSRWACQRRTSAGVILSIGRSANHGRTCSRSQLSVAARVVGLGSSAAHVSHHSAAQALNASRPRWRPRQVPRRISMRFSAARSRASSGVSTVLPPWEPSSSRQETR
jgi:peptidoglycan/LPS O-acetylase OafA/YrhL